MRVVDEELFEKAQDIAHGFFWMSDDTAVVEASREYIQKYHIPPRHDLLAFYVAVICHQSVKEEVRQLESRTWKEKLRGIWVSWRYRE